MRWLLIRWALAAAALFVTVRLFSDQGLAFSQPGWWLPFKLVLLLGLFNALVRPLLFLLKLATFPLMILTLGLSSLGLSLLFNAAGLFLADRLNWGLEIGGEHPVLTAFYAALTMSVLNAVFSLIAASGRRLARGAAA
jgi:uncharacterized membrane protein YvlD (DUF360 family)